MLELLDEVEEVVLEMLEDQVDFALLFEGLLYPHHVLASQHLQHLYLSLDCLT